MADPPRPPVHEALEALRRLMGSKPGDFHGAFEEFGKSPGWSPFATTQVPKPSPDLLSTYVDQKRLFLDVDSRPDNYDSRQKEIVGAWRRGEEPKKPATPQERNALAMAFISPNAPVRKRLIRRRLEEDDTTMEDGRTLTQATHDHATFERQDHGDRIII